VKKVVIIQRIFPEYRKPIFDAIQKKVGFVMLHSTNKSGIKQTFSSYSKRIKKWQYGKGDTHLFLNVFGYIRKNRPKVIIHELAIGILSLPLVVLGRKIFGYKFILWGHMYNRKSGYNPQGSLGDKYRFWLQKKADAIITYSNREKEELVNYGICSQKIFPALNTLDTNKYLAVRDQLEKVGKPTVKHNLGIPFQYNLIFIGRLYEDKWPHHAIEVLDFLVNKMSLPVALHFVGSGEMENFLVEYANNNNLQNNVYFHKEIYDELKTGELLFASDMMIMPGCVGLSVNHAFCFDCPVITFATHNCVPAHGPEIEYIIQGKTGIVINNKSTEDMANAVYNYLKNEVLQQEFKSHIRNLIENVCPIEKLTNGFNDAIHYVQKK
jgi:glycosyltransferase involved in cell wall biosynthesis